MLAPRHVRTIMALTALGALGLPVRGEGDSHAAAPTPTPVPARVASAPSNGAVDPVERLRQRLSERLAGRSTGGPVAEGMPVSDFRLTPRASAAPAATPMTAPRSGPTTASTTAPSAAPSAAPTVAPPRAATTTAHAETPRAASLRAAAPPARRGDAHWGYEGAVGPAAWGGLRPDFGLCAKGLRQSPIDIQGGLAVDLEPVRFMYQPGRFAVLDNGHTVQVNVAPGSAIELAGRRFELVQFHFHRPSEEVIDGRQFEMSVHLVHKDADGRLAVVAVLLQAGPAQPVVQTVWNHLPLEKNEEQPARVTIDPTGLLPPDRGYYTYMGSLTTPPCSEGVQWVVMRAPVGATAEQIALFSRLYPMNARPVQAASGRRILQSN